MIKFFIEPGYEVKQPERERGNAGIDFFIPSNTETFVNAFKQKDIRKKMFYTFFALIVVRIGSQLPVPGVNTDYISQWFNQQTGLNFFDQMTGGSFTSMSIFALSITPYITSSIIMQLLAIAIPKLEERCPPVLLIVCNIACRISSAKTVH